MMGTRKVLPLTLNVMDVLRLAHSTRRWKPTVSVLILASVHLLLAQIGCLAALCQGVVHLGEYSSAETATWGL